MDNHIIRPPNSQYMSDEVIGGVLENKRHARRLTASDTENARSYGSQRSPYHSERSEQTISRELARTYLEDTRSAASHDSRPNAAQYSPTTSRRAHQHESIPRNTLPHGRVEGAGVSQSTTNLAEAAWGENPYAATIQEVIAEKERIRALRRERQIRYRKKKHDYMLSLEAETKELRGEIKDLDTRRRTMCAVVPPQQNVWSAVVEYFRLFRYGYHPNATESSSAKRDTQLDFLRANMTEDVLFNSDQGVEAIIRSWRRVSLWFQDVEVELEGLEKGVEGSIIAATTTRVTINERTLRNVFPHLFDGSDARRIELVGRLLGERFTMCGWTHFEWDRANQRVSIVIAISDMLSTMLRLFGSLEDVSIVLEGARISSDFQWNSTYEKDT